MANMYSSNYCMYVCSYMTIVCNLYDSGVAQYNYNILHVKMLSNFMKRYLKAYHM